MYFKPRTVLYKLHVFISVEFVVLYIALVSFCPGIEWTLKLHLEQSANEKVDKQKIKIITKMIKFIIYAIFKTEFVVLVSQMWGFAVSLCVWVSLGVFWTVEDVTLNYWTLWWTFSVFSDILKPKWTCPLYWPIDRQVDKLHNLFPSCLPAEGKSINNFPGKKAQSFCLSLFVRVFDKALCCAGSLLDEDMGFM